MELEAAALEVASTHWRNNVDDAVRVIRNKNRQLSRDKAGLLTRLRRRELEIVKLEGENASHRDTLMRMHQSLSAMIETMDEYWRVQW